ncbi:MAG TPA: enoyl-CoA hydratase/isomerase family protein, partial [Mycobacterium sp.]|nr:enoyl-CoA hydratase/isomerase family protein [Mycobacterium sp.]
MTVTLDYADQIAIVRLGEDENRFSPGFLDDIDDALSQAASDGAQGLITTAGGKFYSNGLDLEWLS